MTQSPARPAPSRIRSFGNGSASRLAPRFLIAGLLAFAGGVFTTPVLAQTPARADEDAKRANLSDLADFVHYVKIARYDAAKSSWLSLQARQLSDVDFVQLVEASGDIARFDDAVQKASRTAALSDVGAAMMRKYEKGKLSRARHPSEIARNITELTGTLRGKLLAQERLRAAGEYAMPQLLEAYLDQSNPARRSEARLVIAGMGRNAVAPLCAALTNMPPAQQEQAAMLLGDLQWRTSLPYLADCRESTSSDAVRAACNRAITALGGTEATTADLYVELAEAFYSEKPEVMSFPGEDFQLLWEYSPAAGLTMTEIRTPVYHEARAMRLAERALSLQSASGGANPDTVALWVASNYSRELDTPAGYVNPAYPVRGAAGPGLSPRRGAEYFGVASGADISQRVLGRALDTKDTPLARLALAAVERTAGVKALGDGTAARLPLVEALGYPNRRVQYDAALAIAAAQPATAFPASDRVVPTLASSLRGASSLYAAVICNDTEQYQMLRGLLQGQGYTVMPQGRTLADLEAPIAESPAVDLVVLAGHGAERAAAMINEAAGTPKTSATPVLALSTPDGYAELRTRFEGNPRVAVRQVGITPDAVTTSVNGLVTTASGGAISADEARAYAARAVRALRDLAVSGGEVLKVSDATLPLVGAFAEAKGQVKLDLGEVLARINAPSAQGALADAALGASTDERISLLGLTAQSAKRFGNLLEARHTTRVMELASTGNDAEATAAAALLGALNTSSGDVVPLILRKP